MVVGERFSLIFRRSEIVRAEDYGPSENQVRRGFNNSRNSWLIVILNNTKCTGWWPGKKDNPVRLYRGVVTVKRVICRSAARCVFWNGFVLRAIDITSIPNGKGCCLFGENSRRWFVWDDLAYGCRPYEGFVVSVNSASRVEPSTNNTLLDILNIH